MVYDNTNFEFSIRSMKNLFREVTNLRISEGSAEELGEELDEFATEVSEKAIEIAEEKGRKTVRGEDIRDAIREL